MSWTRFELATFDMTNQHSASELPAEKYNYIRKLILIYGPNIYKKVTTKQY
jgi:hypothetical protein